MILVIDLPYEITMMPDVYENGVFTLAVWGNVDLAPRWFSILGVMDKPGIITNSNTSSSRNPPHKDSAFSIVVKEFPEF